MTSYPSAARTLLLASLGLASLAHSATAQVLYSETFDNLSGGNQTVSSSGWYAYRGSTATDISSAFPSDGGTVGSAGVSGLAGNPSSPTGYLYAQSGSAQAPQFSLVTTFSEGISITTGTPISFTMGNSTTSSLVRILVQVGGDGSVGSGTWYAYSHANFGNSSAYSQASFSSASTASVTFSFNFTTAYGAWRDFTLDPGSEMAIGGASDLSALPSNTITGIGFFTGAIGGTNATVRLDNLTIGVVPEPATAGLTLAAMGILAAFILRRGKKTSEAAA